MLWNIIKQHQEFQISHTINYVQFKKAFKSIHRESLWQTVQLYGVLPKYINMSEALYCNSTCVRPSSGVSDDFDIMTV